MRPPRRARRGLCWSPDAWLPVGAAGLAGADAATRAAVARQARIVAESVKRVMGFSIRWVASGGAAASVLRPLLEGVWGYPVACQRGIKCFFALAAGEVGHGISTSLTEVAVVRSAT